MLRESYFSVISFGFRRGEQNDFGLGAKSRLRQFNQSLSNSLFLIFLIYREIRKITAVFKIRHGTRDANEQVAIPRRAEEAGIFKHCSNASRVTHWPSFGQGRPPQHINKFRVADLAGMLINDVHINKIMLFACVSQLSFSLLRLSDCSR